MNARSRLAVWLFTALAVVVILAVALAPTVLSWRLRTAVARSFAGSPQVSVQVNAPPWAIVTGALDGLNPDGGWAGERERSPSPRRTCRPSSPARKACGGRSCGWMLV